nr:hypothetical protein [Tanacetum cinerariifolium]
EGLDRDGERGFDYLTIALVLSKASANGVGLRQPTIMAGEKGIYLSCFFLHFPFSTEPANIIEELEVQPVEVTADSGESPKAVVFVVHPGSVAARVKERKCKTRGCSLRPHIQRKLASGSSSSRAMLNRRAREFLQVIKKMSGEADVIKARERSQADKSMLEAVEVSLHEEVEELKQDRRDVVSKVVHYATIALVHSDELGRLVGKLVSFAITYRRCRAYEQVAVIKEPFELSKSKGYLSSN